MTTAVAFIVFNRPGLTRTVLAAIRAARPPLLFVIADGPRAGRADDAVNCAAVRALVEAGVDWPCEVVKIYSDENLGCARRVSSGLNAVFGSVEEAIILEDDCLPDPSFFPFCEELLARFRNDERVGQIAGCSFLPAVGAGERESYFFSRYPHCWGWATWRRAWRHYDPAMTHWRGSPDDGWWPDGLGNRGERRQWTQALDGVKRGAVDSWAYRWTVTLWRLRMRSVNARPNLVSNLGFGTEATHTKQGDLGGLPLVAVEFPLKHPCDINAGRAWDETVSRRVFRPRSLVARVRSRLKRILG